MHSMLYMVVTLTCLLGHAVAYVEEWCHPSAASFSPRGVGIGQQLNSNTGSVRPFTLNSRQAVSTIDYGLERAGLPFFHVSLVEGPVQIEVKYSEQFNALGHPWSDGPYSFQNGLSNTFRVETYNVTKTGRFTSPLIQGGQRWQSIKLLTGKSISFSCVGFEATVDTTDVDKLPGNFESSDQKLNSIWKLGAVAASTSCFEKGSQPAVWKVDETKGAYITSLRPSQSSTGIGFANYTLEFDTLIDRGGVWWSVSSPLAAGAGLQLLLVGDLPSASTFANTNRTLLPPNSILLSWGYDFVNQTTLTSFYLDTFRLPFKVLEKTWHRLATKLSPSGHLSVLLDGHEVFNVSMPKYYTGPPGPYSGSFSSFKGTFGFGAWQDQAAYVRNVRVTAADGKLLYTNPMKNSKLLQEFGTGPNIHSVCLDGPKRDRLVWLGDFYHTSRIIGVSTGRADLARSTLEFFLSHQIESGELAISPSMSYDLTPEQSKPALGTFGLFDYQLLGMSALYNYVRYSNDLSFIKKTWPGWQKQLDWIIDKFNSKGDDLWYAPSAFLGPSQGSAVSCAALQSLRQFGELADAVGDKDTKKKCTDTSELLQISINAKLWNSRAGFYALDPTAPDQFSVAGSAFCITSGAASQSQRERLMQSLEHLRLGPGFLDNSAVDRSDQSLKISPNTNGFLLDALHQSGASSIGYGLLKSLWGAMVINPRTSSGASWEYLDVDGNPGLGRFTSLGHPWGGAATYVLTEWYAGIQPAEGRKGFGYTNWVINPEVGVSAGLWRVRSEVPTSRGILGVDWKVMGKELTLVIQAPEGTSGIFKFKGKEQALQGKSTYRLSVKI